MQKYYAPRRYICGAWTGEPITKYVASEIEIKEKITTFELNTPKKTTYVVNFINSETKNEDFVFDKTAKIDRSKCIGCGACISICPVHAIQMMTGWYCVVQEDKCVGCGKCMELCHKKAPQLQNKLY